MVQLNGAICEQFASKCHLLLVQCHEIASIFNWETFHSFKSSIWLTCWIFSLKMRISKHDNFNNKKYLGQFQMMMIHWWNYYHDCTFVLVYSVVSQIHMVYLFNLFFLYYLHSVNFPLLITVITFHLFPSHQHIFQTYSLFLTHY